MNCLWSARHTALRCALVCFLPAAVFGCRRKESAAKAAPAPAAAVGVESRAAPEQASGPASSPVAAAPKTIPAARPIPLRIPRRTGPMFSLPTKNDGLFRDDPVAFFMFVDRYSPDGKVTQVWQGGTYGFVRNARTTLNGEVFTKFHEGIDIAPVDRDAAGEPLDVIHAIANGTVVFCAPNAASNYGNYIVIEHPCGENWGTFYSLYAHLHRIDTTAGTVVKRGDSIALMGHTGEGIDRRRSHMHLELCMLASDRFNEFYARHYKLGNPNGNWHGHNLIGLDAAAFLKAARAEPGLTPGEFLTTLRPYYQVRIPGKSGQELELVRRYPWLRRPGEPSASWEISFTGAGVPLAVAPSPLPCALPAVSWVTPSSGSHSWNTRNHLGGSGPTATLAVEGARYVQLVSGDF